MEEHVAKILQIKSLTHDVKSFKIEKPAGYQFVPGQATEVAINKPGWTDQRRPFTFTSLNDAPYLEFIIKGYPAQHGVTDAIHKLQVGDQLLIHDVWGAISYKGPGVFIAGGAGITPFIAIFRKLHEDKKLQGNKLIFSNKTAKDIILRDELESMLGKDFVPVITSEEVSGIYNKHINKDYLKATVQNFDQHFYICGPEKFTEEIGASLTGLGAKADSVVFEK